MTARSFFQEFRFIIIAFLSKLSLILNDYFYHPYLAIIALFYHDFFHFTS